MSTAPDRSEAAAYFFTYIDKVDGGDILTTLERQLASTVTLLESVDEAQSLHRYQPGKWSIREVVGHLNDTERVFAFRALWFARALDTPLPSFDQDLALASAGSDAHPLTRHVEEFATVRASTLALFRNLPAEAWTRRGTASGNPFSVNALAYVCAGHVEHHVRILKDRYLGAAV
ncbi:MAG: DinB family protein [Vicinamibacterales bacterium]